MEELQRLQEKLTQRRAETSREDLRADCFAAGLKLERLEVYLKAKLEQREVRQLMRCCHENTDRAHIVQPYVSKPFHEDRPIKQLFLFNINF